MNKLSGMVGLKLRIFSALLASVMAFGVVAAQAKPEFSAVTVDARNGQILFDDHADGQRHPASLTKMMTLYLLFQDMKSGRVNRNTRFKVSERAANMAPSSLEVDAGTTISADEAIKAIITKSANDVAAAIAENLGGSESAFAARMTRVAHSIGMNHSHFNNASGLPDPGQITTARDMATLGLRIMRDFPQYYPYFRITSFEFHGRTIRTHNNLVLHYPGTDGFKTGYIVESGFNLATSTKRGDKRLVGVVLGARSAAKRERYMRNMLERNFAKAKEGQTIAAVAGSSLGVINPVAAINMTSEGRKPVGMNNLGLAAASAEAATNEDSDKTETASMEPALPKVMDAQLEPIDNAKKTAKFPFAVVSTNDKPGNLAASFGESWNVQVGSFAEKPAAEEQLAAARTKFASQLSGKPGFTMQNEKGGVVVYRARFAGFTASTAAKVCAAVKRSGSTCLMISPES